MVAEGAEEQQEGKEEEEGGGSSNLRTAEGTEEQQEGQEEEEEGGGSSCGHILMIHTHHVWTHDTVPASQSFEWAICPFGGSRLGLSNRAPRLLFSGTFLNKSSSGSDTHRDTGIQRVIRLSNFREIVHTGRASS